MASLRLNRLVTKLTRNIPWAVIVTSVALVTNERMGHAAAVAKVSVASGERCRWAISPSQCIGMNTQ